MIYLNVNFISKRFIFGDFHKTRFIFSTYFFMFWGFNRVNEFIQFLRKTGVYNCVLFLEKNMIFSTRKHWPHKPNQFSFIIFNIVFIVASESWYYVHEIQFSLEWVMWVSSLLAFAMRTRLSETQILVALKALLLSILLYVFFWDFVLFFFSDVRSVNAQLWQDVHLGWRFAFVYFKYIYDWFVLIF